jgi:hypothetical protein
MITQKNQGLVYSLVGSYKNLILTGSGKIHPEFSIPSKYRAD